MYTFIIEDNHEIAKVVNKNVFDDKLNYEDYKNALLNRSYMSYEMNKIQSKIIIQDRVELIKQFYLLTMTKIYT